MDGILGANTLSLEFTPLEFEIQDLLVIMRAVALIRIYSVGV